MVTPKGERDTISGGDDYGLKYAIKKAEPFLTLPSFSDKSIWVYFRIFFLHIQRPIRPDPKRNKETGSGTGEGPGSAPKANGTNNKRNSPDMAIESDFFMFSPVG
jgi:hypothetical protein